MALFVTGLVLILIFGAALLGARFFDFTLVYDLLLQLSTAVGLAPDFIYRLLPIVGATLMVIGQRQMLMEKVTCDECGWQGPKRRFIQGCKRCGSHNYH